jgi:DNA excision repair protein ERCC-4
MKIIIDYREKASGLIELIEKEDVLVEVKKISYGDYIINDFVTMERKTAQDFLISILDGRLFSQLSNLKKHCVNPILLIEGNPYQTDIRMNPKAIKGAILSTQAVWYIPVIHSRSKEDTKEIIIMISRQNLTYADVVLLRGGYRPKRLKSKQLFLLQGLPKVGPLMAKRLIEHFKTVSKIVNATTEELMEIEGIGRVSAETIREVLDKECF